MPQYEQVVLVGVGLLGGSVGLALLERGLARHVIGVGRDERTLDQALALGAVSEISTDLEAACSGADLVVACTPVQTIAKLIGRCLGSNLAEHAMLTDVGSTKVSICSALAGIAQEQFCGSHPIAGSDKSGVVHASGQLFEGRLTVITPTLKTPESLIERLEELWHSLGGRTIRMSPPEHDQAIAQVSHLPHVVAAALSAQTDTALLPLAGPGWSDTTRVAGGNVDLWQQIIAENRGPVVDALWKYSHSLLEWIEAIEDSDATKLIELLTGAKANRDRSRGQASS